jgi:hypothetical protein
MQQAKLGHGRHLGMEIPMKRTIMFCPLLLLFVAHSAVAVPHKVGVQAGNKEAEPVVDALKARLSGTERYQVVSGSGSVADFTINVLCDDLEKYKITGAICSYSFLYFHPLTLLGVPIPIGRSMGLLSSSERATIGEMLFQAFVEATTEQRILDARANVESSISWFCMRSENAKTCGR